MRQQRCPPITILPSSQPLPFPSPAAAVQAHTVQGPGGRKGALCAGEGAGATGAGLCAGQGRAWGRAARGRSGAVQETRGCASRGAGGSGQSRHGASVVGAHQAQPHRQHAALQGGRHRRGRWGAPSPRSSGTTGEARRLLRGRGGRAPTPWRVARRSRTAKRIARRCAASSRWPRRAPTRVGAAAALQPAAAASRRAPALERPRPATALAPAATSLLGVCA